MKSHRRIPPPEMKFRAANYFLLLLVSLLALFVSGCSTNEPDNASVRPWNTPQDWENGLGGMNTQHP
jgi:hypothetical protein